MELEYLEILRSWERTIGRPALYANLDRVFPEYAFRRLQKGTEKDHWASRYKMDLTLPKKRNAEKTVVYAADMCFREQGEWADGIDAIEKLMKDRGLGSVSEAFAFLDNMFDLNMPRPDSKEVSEYKYRISRRKGLLEALKEYFSEALWDMSSRNAGKVRSYLSSVRGFSKEQSKALFLGFVPSWDEVVRYVTLKLGYTIEELDEVCGVRNSEGKTAVGSVFTLAVPYSSAGEVRGFIFRRVGEGSGPKYIASRNLDRKSRFFNMPVSVPEGKLLVVEGEFDALKLEAEGFTPAVAIGGSDLSGERVRMVRDAIGRGVRSFVLCLDLDEKEGGEPDRRKRYLSTLRSIHAIKEAVITLEDIRVVEFNTPTDPDEFVRTYGKKAFQRLIDEALPYWKYIELNN